MAQTTNNKDKINRAKPLETIDDVCRTSSQIFLTRDEIIAYQLPTKLSHLTKLKNNQLLALPLAINLSKAIKNNNERSSLKDNHTTSNNCNNNNDVNDIRQIVIECGRVMKICGVYEDVLPLIENGSNNVVHDKINGCKNKNEIKQQQHHTRQLSSSSHNASYEQQATNLYYQMASQPPTSALLRHQMAAAAAAAMVVNQQASQAMYHPNYHHQNDFQQLNKAIQSESSKQRRTLRSLKLRYAQNQCILAENGAGSYLGNQTNPFTYDYSHNKVAPIPQVKQQQHQVIKLRGRQQECSQQAVGQRYARCILLSQKSIDKITNCNPSSSSFNVNTKQFDRFQDMNDNDDNEDADDENEHEVLIPIDQKGRFYLCATNQSIVTQLYCHNCHDSALIQPSLVFRLSQIVSLINLSRRLAQKNRQQQQHQVINNRLSYRQDRVITELPAEPVKLPLPVQLVIGPRPKNFSPTMFGSSSTMESYFRVESNIGGHSIQCSYNKQCNNDVQQKFNNRNNLNDISGQKKLNDEAMQVCSCAQRLLKTSVESDEYYGLFSAALRIEKIVKRDVLLACTIKQDPLLHLDLFSSECSQLLSATNNNGEQIVVENNSSSRSNRKKNRNSGDMTTKTAATTGDFIGGFLSSNLAADKMNKSNKLISLRESTNIVQGDNSTATAITKLDLKSIGKSSFSRLRACRSLISLNGRRKKRPNIPTSMLMVPTAGAAAASLSSSSSGIGLSSFDCATPGGATSVQASYPYPYPYSRSNSNSHSHLSEESRRLNSSDTNANSSIVLIEFDCNNEQLQFTRTFVESSIPTSTIPDLVLKRMEYCYRNSTDWERQLKLSHLTLRQDFDSCQLQMSQSRKARFKEQQQHLSSSSISSNNNTNLTQNQTSTNTASSLSSSLAAFQISDSTSASNSGSSSSSSRSSSGVSSSVAASDCATLMNSQKIHKKLMMRNCHDGGRARHLEAGGADIYLKSSSSVRAIEALVDRSNQFRVASGQFGGTSLGDMQPAARAGSGASEESEDSGSHLYESLERLNESRLQQEVRCLDEQVKATSRSSALKNNEHGNKASARSRLKMGKSMDFLVNCKSSRLSAIVTGQGKGYNDEDFGDEEEEEEEEDDDDDWWQRSTYNMREQPQRQVTSSSRETRQGQYAKNVAANGELADNWSSGVQTNRMEPVSIEACNDEFVSVVDDDFNDDDNDIAAVQRAKGERASIEEACSEISSYQSSSGFCYTCSSIK